MKTVTVILDNFIHKERLLVDLATLGYKVLLADVEDADIVVTDPVTLVSLRQNADKKIIICLMDVGDEGITATLLANADDIIYFPYQSEELDMRLKLALSKRGVETAAADENTLAIDGLTINTVSYEVQSDGIPLDLTYKEFELLRSLATARGRVFTRDQLLSSVWGYDYFGGARTVDVHIRRLRAKLGRYESYIETVRNVGYRFKK